MVKDEETGENLNPLNRFLDVPGGIERADALQRASDSLELIRHDAAREIDQCLLGIAALLERSAPFSELVHQNLHCQGNSIFCLAGMYGLNDLSAAAHSLCELVDLQSASNRWDRGAVEVHLDAMRKLRHPDSMSPPDAQALVEGLLKVTQHFGGARFEAAS